MRSADGTGTELAMSPSTPNADATAPAASPASSTDALYDSGGNKPPLLLLHGIGGTWHVWKPVLALLETRHRVIAVTLPGHYGGVRYAGSEPATVAGLADQLIAMLRARGIESAHIAGNSLGGWLSVELARRGFARSVVALSPAGGWTTMADYRAVARLLRTIYLLLPLMLVLTGWLLRFAAVRKLLGKKSMVHGDRVPAEDFRHSFQAMARTDVLPQLLDTMGRDGPVAAFRPTVPVTIAWSEQDQVIPFTRYGESYLRSVAGARGIIVTGVGHVPMYDDPEQVAARILEQTAAAASPA